MAANFNASNTTSDSTVIDGSSFYNFTTILDNNICADPNKQEECHCGEYQYIYDDHSTECDVIQQLSHEKALSIILFLYGLLIIVFCIYCLAKFWRHRHFSAHRMALKTRRAFYTLLSYSIILPMMLMECISTIYLYYSSFDPARDDKWYGVNYWTNIDGTPIYYSQNTDLALHFLYWIGFWFFFQLKVFKFSMLRYDFEYAKVLANIEWKDHLGLRTVQPRSMFLKHRAIFGNEIRMLLLQIVILIIIISIQMIIRLTPSAMDNPNSSLYEMIFISIFAVVEYIFVIWFMKQIRSINDNLYIKPESNRIFVTSIIGGIIFVVGLMIIHNGSIDYIWRRLGTTVTIVTWIGVWCFYETIWILNRLEQQYGMQQKPIKLDSFTGSSAAISADIQRNVHLKLEDVLLVQEGFEAMMRYLVKEFSCENLLCFVELSQYITQWDESTEPRDLRIVHEFAYFENPEFMDELSHYEYILQKYIYDSAVLEVNISGGLRYKSQKVSPGVDSERVIRLMNDIRQEIWSLLRDSFSRFRVTAEYKRLQVMMATKKDIMKSSMKSSTYARKQNVENSVEDDNPLLFDKDEQKHQYIQMNKVERMESVEMYCTSVNNCSSINNVRKALEYYSNVDIDHDMDKWIKYCETENKGIIDDFNHIIREHNNDEDIGVFAANACDLSSCNLSTRYHRNKREDKNEDGIFWRDLLDSMHCYFYHIYDFGYRVKGAQSMSGNIGDDCIDNNFGSIYKQVKKRREILSKLDRFDRRSDTNKYNIAVQQQSESKEKDVDVFSIGYIFYYWKHYKDLTNKKEKMDNINDLSGYSASELYIEKKYSSLKEEILSNKNCTLTRYQFEDVIKKAKEYMATKLVKNIISTGGSYLDHLHYNIKPNTPLTITHLVSIILYCDWTELCTSFSASFRKTEKDETLSSIKNRNREYWNWSRLLRETVELYGQNAKGYANGNPVPVKGPFYCGMSFVMAMPQFNMRLCGPTSTSMQVTVAARFAGDEGIIMQLNNNGNKNSNLLQIFDCSWISKFNGEDERLLMGGLYRIRIESIINIATTKNFHVFFHALFSFDCILSGSDQSEENRDKMIEKKDYAIIHHLIKGDKDCDEYIVNTFNMFCDHKKQIIVNLFFTENYYEKLSDLLYASQEQKEIIFQQRAFALFKNMEEIIIYSGQYDQQFEVNVLSLLPLFNTSNQLEIKVKAHNPSWILRQFGSNNEFKLQKEAKDYDVSLSKTFDYYGKVEDCMTITRK